MKLLLRRRILNLLETSSSNWKKSIAKEVLYSRYDPNQRKFRRQGSSSNASSNRRQSWFQRWVWNPFKKYVLRRHVKDEVLSKSGKNEDNDRSNVYRRDNKDNPVSVISSRKIRIFNNSPNTQHQGLGRNGKFGAWANRLRVDVGDGIGFVRTFPLTSIVVGTGARVINSLTSVVVELTLPMNSELAFEEEDDEMKGRDYDLPFSSFSPPPPNPTSTSTQTSTSVASNKPRAVIIDTEEIRPPASLSSQSSSSLYSSPVQPVGPTGESGFGASAKAAREGGFSANPPTGLSDQGMGANVQTMIFTNVGNVGQAIKMTSFFVAGECRPPFPLQLWVH